MKENSTPTRLETIKQRAEEYFRNLPKQEQFSHLVFKKAWIYQAKCAVVDFKYKVSANLSGEARANQALA